MRSIPADETLEAITAAANRVAARYPIPACVFEYLDEHDQPTGIHGFNFAQECTVGEIIRGDHDFAARVIAFIATT